MQETDSYNVASDYIVPENKIWTKIISKTSLFWPGYNENKGNKNINYFLNYIKQNITNIKTNIQRASQ